MNRTRQKLKIGSILLFGILVFPLNGWAALSVALSPIEGGATLRFSRSDVMSGENRELRIRVTSTDAKQYQVFQRWVQPLSSNSSAEIDRDFLQFYGIVGSNGAGTLYGQLPEYITMTDQLVYTSSGNGASDNFVLAYRVNTERLPSSGQFMGRLLISVRPLSSGATQEAYLDVFVDADLDFNIRTEGENGFNVIRLNTRDKTNSQDRVSFAYEGNAGELRVYQQVLSPISSVSDNTDLARGVVTYYTEGQTDGVQVREPTQFDFERKMIYRAWDTQGAWDVVYSFDPDSTFPIAAGLFRGRIRYEVEASGHEEHIDFDIEIQVDPVFELVLDFPEDGVDFSNLYPGAAPREHVVKITVNSNLQKSYTVSQKLSAPLKNENQAIFDADHFLIKTAVGPNSSGKGRMPEYTPVSSSSEDILYISDDAGSSAEFEVRYRLEPYSNMSPGNYRTEITYTLGEI